MIARNSRGVLAGIADDHDVTAAAFLLVFEKPVQVVAADFFFALDDELHVHRQRADRLQPRLDRLDVRVHLPLVVGGAAGVDAAITDGRLEGGRLPAIERIGRLHVVVTVDQGRRRSRGTRPFAVHDRMPGGLDQFRRQSRCFETFLHKPGCLADIVAVPRVGTDAGDPQQILQFVDEAVGVLFEEGFDLGESLGRIHVGAPGNQSCGNSGATDTVCPNG